MSYKTLALVLCALAVPAISQAITQDNDDTQVLRLFFGDADTPETMPADNSAERTDVSGNYMMAQDLPQAPLPGTAETPAYGDLGCCRACCCPDWTVTADAMIMNRIGNKSTTILPRLRNGNGALVGSADVLNSNDFDFGFAAGPRLSLVRHTQYYDCEVVYFGIDGWSDVRIVPQSLNPASPLLFDWSSKLYNVELNVRWNPCCEVAVLAGFRWAELREDFRGGRFFNPDFIPIGDTETTNDLYGFQLGADARLWQYGCFSISGLCKAGIYLNHANQTSDFTLAPNIFSASTNHTAFLGEAGLQARYQFTQRFAARAGYELLWLDGVAIAPAQTHNLLGIDSKNTVFYHGATAGLEVCF